MKRVILKCRVFFAAYKKVSPFSFFTFIYLYTNNPHFDGGIHLLFFFLVFVLVCYLLLSLLMLDDGEKDNSLESNSKKLFCLKLTVNDRVTGPTVRFIVKITNNLKTHSIDVLMKMKCEQNTAATLRLTVATRSSFFFTEI